MTSWWSGWRRPGSSPAESGSGRRLCVILALAIVAVTGTVPAGSEDPGGPGLRRLGVVGFYNPRLMYAKYQQLVDYLSDATGEPWTLVVTLHYQETVEALCRGDLDVAYLGPFTALRAHAACGAAPVVRLNTGGRATYRSYLMVRQDAAIRSVGDLRGSTFAFGSPLSTSSHLVPRLMLEEAGLHPGADLTCRYFGHHDRAARSVLIGEADACGVRDIVGQRFEGRGLRVLARSDPLPNFPLVAAPGAPPELLRSLVEALVERPARDPGVRERIRGWDGELAGGFAPASEDDYRSVLGLIQRLFGPPGLTAPPEALMCGGVGGR